jgi:enoyl-CoA hydratase/carnithine racemase
VTDLVRYEVVADHVVRLTLDRPPAANALSLALFAELDAAVRRIEADHDVRVWLLTGAPRPDGRPWFSVGADMKDAFAADRPTIDPAAVIDHIDDLLKPSIAVVPGFCTTGALELVMACDLRIAGTSARFCDWHLKATGLGIGRWGAAARLSRLVGLDKAKELLLTGDEIDGDEAKAIGLVNRVVPDKDLQVHAIELASTIASMPPKGVRTTLGYLSLQEDMAKREAIAFADRAPELMGLKLRPFRDAAERFTKRDKGET